MGCRASRDCSTDVDRGAQTCGPAVGTWPAANCNPAKVLFGSEVTEGTDLDTGVFRKESGLSPGAKAAACGTGAVVDARSSAAPARQQAWSPVTKIVAPDVVGVGVGVCGGLRWEGGNTAGGSRGSGGRAPAVLSCHSPLPGSCSQGLRFRTLRVVVAASHQYDSSSSTSGSGTVYSAPQSKRRTGRLYL